MDYNQYKFLSFDCYGTLIDWETGIWNAFQRIKLLNNRTELYINILKETTSGTTGAFPSAPDTLQFQNLDVGP